MKHIKFKDNEDLQFFMNMPNVTANKFAYRHIAGAVKELIRLNPWRMDAMLKNEAVPSSKSSSTPCLLFTKSMSAIEAATVPVKFIKVHKIVHAIMYHNWMKN